jgi:predicted nucleic acid-binding protein
MNKESNASEIESIRDMLVSTHLYYDAGTKSLRARAFAEIIIKILFLRPEKKARFTEIAEEAAKIVGVPRLTSQDVQSGLEFLKDKGVITKSGNFWFLKREESERIRADLKNTQTRIDHILDKHFGTKIDKEILRSWFKNVAVEFFGRFSEVWAKKLKREAPNFPDANQIKNIISSSIKEHHLESNAQILIDGFNNFLHDNEDFIIEQQIWSFAQSMLAARLVTASVGPDPLSIGEFRESKLLLDTNVLFTAMLEKSRLSAAFSALASSIKQIGASFLITRETEQEYEAVVARKKLEAIRAVENFPLEVLEESKDPFLKTAISRGCVDKASFYTFFTSIQQAPDKIGDEKIECLDDKGTNSAIEASRKDFKKQAQIAAEWKAQRHYDKAKRSIEHDAALDSVVDHLRKDGAKSYVVSADAPMQTLAVRWAGSRPPSWIGIDTLIQILAVSSGGPGHRPENFIPLFGTIIRDDIHCDDMVYTLEDLDALLDLEERVKELSTQEIEAFATKARRLRMAGKSRNDSELQLEIRRTFQRKKMTGVENTIKLEKAIDETRENLRKESDHSAATMVALIGQIYRIERIKKLGWWLLKSLSIFIAGFLLSYFGIKLIATNEALGYFLLSLGVAEFLIPLFIWIIPAYKKIDGEVKILAGKKAEEAIKNIN